MWCPRVARSARLLEVGVLAVIIAGCSSGTEGRSPATESRTPSPSSHAVRWLAYQGGDNFEDRVRLVGADGSQDHAIAGALPGRTAHPDFSPDGTQLVFDQMSEDSEGDQLYVSDKDGNQPRLVAQCRPPTCLGQWEASWSPDGRRLAIQTGIGPMGPNGPTRNGVAIVDLATQVVDRILIHPSRDGQDHFPRWSPDGSTLAFWRERPAPDGSIETAIFRVDASGQHLRQLTPWDLLAGDPDWSPDGSAILFSTRPLLVFDQGQSELYLMNPNGTQRRQVTHNGAQGPRATQPRWTPDGKSILYVQTPTSGFPRHIYTIRPDGTQATPVLTDRDIYTHPALQPGK